MRGMDIELQNVSMNFGDFTAVHPTNLKIKAGEFFSILGPSACGKTTILRMISGFLRPTTGGIKIGGEEMVGVGPDKRPTALIFQHLALFPLMTVWENVAFGLEMRGWEKTKRREKAFELLDLVALGDQGEKKPDELSGGQRQRVAIARALAVEPAVLLLDEPLSALDLKLRQHMRSELRDIQRKTGVTFIYITHDQGEALTMSDRIAVMKAGVIEQVDTTDRVYDVPATAFAATFVGENNLFRGKITSLDADMAVVETKYGALRSMNPQNQAVGNEVFLFVRPEKIQVLSVLNGEQNAIAVEFIRRDLEGPFVNLFFRREDDVFSAHLINAGDLAHDASGHKGICFAPQDGMILPVGEVADE
ncbi:MAG: ABC transporter ATP-binding protein [Rhodospirillales bacterium]|nr:ABC transporter ATP-binding protein [Rhodospirillales bacterium]